MSFPRAAMIFAAMTMQRGALEASSNYWDCTCMSVRPGTIAMEVLFVALGSSLNCVVWKFFRFAIALLSSEI